MTHPWAVGVLFFLLGLAPASAYTSRQVGLDSNILIDSGRVYFAQSDGSLTVLRLQTGEVVARKKGGSYSGTLRRVPQGLLVESYGRISLLGVGNLDPIWQTGSHCEPNVAGDRLVSYDGNGLVECRDLADGKVRWSYHLPGALNIVAENGRVLVFRSAVYDGPGVAPAVVLLDLATGRELLHKTTPPGLHYLAAYFDGERIYLPAGTYDGTYATFSTGYDQGRPSACFQKLLVWNLEGREVDSIPAPESLQGPAGRDEEPFVLGGKLFAGGRVWNSTHAVPPRQTGRARVVCDGYSSNCEQWVRVTSFDLEDGTLTVTCSSDDAVRYGYEGKSTVGVAAESKRGRWSGNLPYLADAGGIEAVASTEACVLLGSNLGHVECVDAQTGRSLWMYLFPTLRQTMSYSGGRGMPPYMADAAATFRRENANRKPPTGLILDGVAAPSAPRIVTDPSPSNPFRLLPAYLSVAWSGAILPPVLTALVLLAGRKRRWDGRLSAGLCLGFASAAVAGLWFYGRVSVGSSIGLRVGLLLALAGAFVASLILLRERHWGFGALCLLLSGGIAVFVLPVFLHL